MWRNDIRIPGCCRNRAVPVSQTGWKLIGVMMCLFFILVWLCQYGIAAEPAELRAVFQTVGK
jgi:lipid-A-disaccharide synthase-like uncharacterized protein